MLITRTNFNYMSTLANFGYKTITTKQGNAIDKRYQSMTPPQIEQSIDKISSVSAKNLPKYNSSQDFRPINTAGAIAEEAHKVKLNKRRQELDADDFSKAINNSNTKTSIKSNMPNFFEKDNLFNKTNRRNLAIGTGVVGLGFGAKYLWDRNQQAK